MIDLLPPNFVQIGQPFWEGGGERGGEGGREEGGRGGGGESGGEALTISGNECFRPVGSLAYGVPENHL